MLETYFLAVPAAVCNKQDMLDPPCDSAAGEAVSAGRIGFGQISGRSAGSAGADFFVLYFIRCEVFVLKSTCIQK